MIPSSSQGHRRVSSGSQIMPTIALVDDDRAAMNEFASSLEADGFRTECYTDGSVALTSFNAKPPDLALLSLKMAPMDGMEMLRRLRANATFPVIFVTTRPEEIDELFGFKMGADDFVRRPFAHRVLIERIKAVLRRTMQAENIVSQDGIIERGLLWLADGRNDCKWRGESVSLTVTEFKILRALALRPGIVKNRNALMDAAYPDQVYVDDRTIDSHVKRLRKKFKAVDPQFDMIETLYGLGYRFKQTS
jgi:two-component system response regulator ChvI